ncbi:hemerythrin domain-containing protein [Streptomyces sp. MUM 203J]|uniref:hemerythrin domain-containing protein n=1 Tax=Streptomyces sp. MUM 203J TaxID=2791990 RepID=UPI001F04D965|nr:hemerythrin domain-containing protein [Streptomyces sp. MUM 203J]MCH0539700.1 hemerythrin domain-containing protein [Streptomyces sp. MUM 203J]
MTHEPDLVQELTSEHVRLHGLLDRVREAAPGSEARGERADETVRLLTAHLDRERRVLGPAALDWLAADGGVWAERLAAERRETGALLRELARAAPHEERFDELLLDLVHAVSAHTRQVDQLLLPRLQAVCPPDELHRLGTRARALPPVTATRVRHVAVLARVRRLLRRGAG